MPSLEGAVLPLKHSGDLNVDALGCPSLEEVPAGTMQYRPDTASLQPEKDEGFSALGLDW